MAGEKQGKDDLFDGFLRFYKTQKISFDCNLCGKSSWVFLEAPENQRVELMAKEVRSDGTVTQGLGPYGIPVLVLACENCYSIRLHASGPIREWIDNNPPQDNDEDAQE